MSILENLSDTELEIELAKRKEAARIAARPKPLANIDWSRVIEVTEEEVHQISKDGREPKDSEEHWIYEAVMAVIISSGITQT